jgi:hypothetical protein
MTEGQKTSAAKTAWHIVEDLPEIEDSSDWVSRSAHKINEPVCFGKEKHAWGEEVARFRS